MHLFARQPEISGNLLARLDARIKIFSASMLLVMVVSCRGFVFPLLTAGLCLGVSLAVGVRPRALAVRFAEPLVIVLMVLLLKTFCSGHEPLFSFRIFGAEVIGHRDGLAEGLLIASRVLGAVSVITLTGFVTPFTEMMAALAWYRVPKGFIDVALFAWRYLFVLLDDAQVVYAAQKNRLGYAGYRRGLRSFGTLTGALVIKAFDNSQTITTAMVQRGYDGTMPLVRHKPFKAADVAVSLTFLACMGILWKI